MPEFVTVGSASELEDGEVRAYEVEGQAISVARVGGSLYAFDDTCTHEMCSLADGDLDGTTIICPCHEGEFDISTGEVLDGPPEEPIAVYPVQVDGDALQIEV